jgi:hypothetical protein
VEVRVLSGALGKAPRCGAFPVLGRCGAGDAVLEVSPGRHTDHRGARQRGRGRPRPRPGTPGRPPVARRRSRPIAASEHPHHPRPTSTRPSARSAKENRSVSSHGTGSRSTWAGSRGDHRHAWRSMIHCAPRTDVMCAAIVFASAMVTESASGGLGATARTNAIAASTRTHANPMTSVEPLVAIVADP